jgi:hypothetical protein
MSSRELRRQRSRALIVFERRRVLALRQRAPETVVGQRRRWPIAKQCTIELHAVVDASLLQSELREAQSSGYVRRIEREGLLQCRDRAIDVAGRSQRDAVVVGPLERARLQPPGLRIARRGPVEPVVGMQKHPEIAERLRTVLPDSPIASLDELLTNRGLESLEVA